MTSPIARHRLALKEQPIALASGNWVAHLFSQPRLRPCSASFHHETDRATRSVPSLYFPERARESERTRAGGEAEMWRGAEVEKWRARKASAGRNVTCEFQDAKSQAQFDIAQKERQPYGFLFFLNKQDACEKADYHHQKKHLQWLCLTDQHAMNTDAKESTAHGACVAAWGPLKNACEMAEIKPKSRIPAMDFSAMVAILSEMVMNAISSSIRSSSVRLGWQYSRA